jgi:hypothetical protein
MTGMITIKIPYDFIRCCANISWSDIKFGLERQLIAPQTAIDKALDKLHKNDNVSQYELELASRSENDSILELVDHLSDLDCATYDEIQDKWLYLALAWLFKNRKSVNDPLAIVEYIYSDFNYPNEIASFVRYMPMIGHDLGDHRKNEERLYEYWKEYLDKASKRFACTVPE